MSPERKPTKKHVRPVVHGSVPNGFPAEPHTSGVYQKNTAPIPDELVGDPIGMYLYEIEQYPLLTPEEEQSLAAQMVQGRVYIGDEKSVDTIRFLSDESKQAYDSLINSNLRLSFSVAKKNRGRGLPFLDLIQEGNIGLMKGIAKFQPERGFKLSTYATWWIRQTVSRAIREKRSGIRLPVHFGDAMAKIPAAEQKLRNELGREPTHDELAEKLSMSAEYLSDVRCIMAQPYSLDMPLDGEASDSTELGDMIAGKDVSLIDAIEIRDDMEVAKRILSHVPPRSRLMFLYRNGYIDGEPHTLQETGDKFSCTRERVRQIENETKKIIYRFRMLNGR
jgi:RNA polymerase primary sigma factor